MIVPVSHLNQRINVRAQPFLAADVGGTHARVALVRAAGQRDIEVLAYRKFTCAEFGKLSELLRVFIEQDVKTPVSRCVIASAGQVIDDVIVNDNLAWRVSLKGLRDALDLDDVALLNDFEALGYAIDNIEESDTLLLCGPSERCDGPVVVVGPGTGLGAAVRLSGPQGVHVLATEAGQMDLAPGTAREREVLARLAPTDGYVAYEKVLSGPGLLNLYNALCSLRGQAPRLKSPEQVTAAAEAGSDADAIEALGMFCALLGSFVGNLTLAYMASGGVYLAGGVLPQIRKALRKSRFVDRFLNKGGMREFLLRVPIRLIEHGRHGVLGAAHWYLDGTQQGSAGPRALGDGTEA